ncbi:hypothetical protein [Serinicoccus kebangsaanensis]|uniref:hypothetical protein n=1 Tax=Serinicoccus kebangsaanensis TaxID=2602069 RepID=UPI00124D0F12|nr:hypothetical protein [Serinicoccus kebangsaanensis]
MDELHLGSTSVVYTVEGSRPRLVVPDRIAPSVSSWGSWVESEVEWIQEDLLTSGLPSTVAVHAQSPVVRAHGLLGLVLAGGTLALVLFGPAPRHGNRWFWFWLIGLPAGLGALAYAVWEVGGWRDHRAPAADRRSGGGYGFLGLLGWGSLSVIAWQLLTWLLGATVIPL